jgi:large subunit ribosomal protein L4
MATTIGTSPAVATYSKTGTKAATAAKLDATVFAVMPENHELLKLAYTAYLANGRENYAVTKTRGLVSGGGRKPWKQKGTGRARFGSSRNPIWRGGGVVFGPTGEENYTKKVPTTIKRIAIRQALSMAAAEGRIKVVETIDVSAGKVKPIIALLSKIEATGRILLVTDVKDEKFEQATRNLQDVKGVQAMYLNVYGIVNAGTIVISQKSLEIVNEWLGGAK